MKPAASRLMRFAVALLAVALCAGARADEALWKLLETGGQVVLLRHATTHPGVGDPPGFRIDDCATQRNLSPAGRDEARKLGEPFRKRAIPVTRVLSSPWCRCIETAELAFGIRPDAHESLSNLFGRDQNRAPQVAQFRKLIEQPPKGGNLVLVSHGVTILAFTGVRPAQGEAIVVTPLGGGALRVAGRLPAPS